MVLSRLVKITQNQRWARILEMIPARDSPADFDCFVDEVLVNLVRTGEFKRVGDHGFPLFHAGDDVGAANPVGFGEIGRRPTGGMIGVGVVETDNVLTALATFALDADQFRGSML